MWQNQNNHKGLNPANGISPIFLFRQKKFYRTLIILKLSIFYCRSQPLLIQLKILLITTIAVNSLLFGAKKRSSYELLFVIRMWSQNAMYIIEIKGVVVMVQNKMYHKISKMYHKTHLKVYVKFPYSRTKHFLTQYFDFAM